MAPNAQNKIVGFEKEDVSNGVTRIIDAEEFNGSITKRVELKSWANFNPNYNFAGQFRGDLLQEGQGLIGIKWVFDGKGAFSQSGVPNYTYLKTNVRNSISNNAGLFDNPSIRQKFEDFGKVANPNLVIDDIDDLLNFINNTDGWFNLMFKIE